MMDGVQARSFESVLYVRRVVGHSEVHAFLGGGELNGKETRSGVSRREGKVRFGVFPQSRNTAVFLSLRDLPHSTVLPAGRQKKDNSVPQRSREGWKREDFKKMHVVQLQAWYSLPLL